MKRAEAIHAHVDWVKGFLARMETEGGSDRAALDVNAPCALDRWLAGEGAPYRNLPAYQDFVQAHEAFHSYARRLADQTTLSEAERTEFFARSRRVLDTCCALLEAMEERAA